MTGFKKGVVLEPKDRGPQVRWCSRRPRARWKRRDLPHRNSLPRGRVCPDQGQVGSRYVVRGGEEAVLPGAVQLDDDVVVAARRAVIVPATRRLRLAARWLFEPDEWYDDQGNKDDANGQSHIRRVGSHGNRVNAYSAWTELWGQPQCWTTQEQRGG